MKAIPGMVLFLSGWFAVSAQTVNTRATSLYQDGIALIPYPREVKPGGADFVPDNGITIVTDKDASENDQFAAGELLKYLNGLGLRPRIAHSGSRKSIYLTRKGADKGIGGEGYTLSVNGDRVIIKAAGEAGLFYGVQTITQLFQKGEGAAVGGVGQLFLKGMGIRDWPDTKIRAAHYDTKHHQDSRAFVEGFIRDLARYKINMLIWEWEDKFEYPSHPEIGAPGAFTMQEMQAFTYYARKYHIQIVPLVQGLGHAGFILKWPQFANLREVPASNFEFCPLREGSYQLLDDLWQDAIKATPGSEYIHIGSDETYELGACPDCKKKEAGIGRTGLYHLFLTRSAKFVQEKGRKAMAWESPMGWAKSRLNVYHEDAKEQTPGSQAGSAVAGPPPPPPVVPRKGLVLTESYDYETPDLKYAKEAKALGYPVFAYDPNPGIEQLFLPYFFSKDGKGDTLSGSLENSYRFLRATMGQGVFDGVIRSTWDDSGLPMQAWMLSFATTAAFSWNAAGPSLPEFTATFFRNRYGPRATGMDTLYRLLNEGAYFYMESFERRVWAWGEIGKTHLPDLPRGDALEYDPFWNTEYAGRVKMAGELLGKMDRALAICKQNLETNIENRYDIEVFGSLAELARHTALTYRDLSELEQDIRQAHRQRFVDVQESYRSLEKAERVIGGQLARRDSVFRKLVDIWDRTRLPKGMSTPAKKYFFEQERTRHFANRAPDMSYLILDERKLGMEEYLVKLKEYMQFFRERFLTEGQAASPESKSR